ncbi:MAG TPA: DNA methyltransferase [Gammaproteobacteria bacterium]|jgi:DNA modification methylase
MEQAYRQFLERKIAVAPQRGFDVSESEISEKLKPMNRRVVWWGLRGGRRAFFMRFGLHKTVTQLEAARQVLAREGGMALIVCPLNVRQEFIRDSRQRLGWETPPRFVRTTEEFTQPGIYLTNYESVREGKIDIQALISKGLIFVSLDEASILRGFGGTKTFREFMAVVAGDDRRQGAAIKTDGVKYRFVATATPAPNEYIELLAYAAFLGIMDVGQAKTRFFKRNSEQADNLTLHPHKEEEFWRWVASWSVWVTKPSDVDPSFSDDGYELPPMDVHWHELPSDHRGAGAEKDGQNRLFSNVAAGIQDAAREKRESLEPRIAKMLELRALDQDAHRLLWHDLEAERHAIEAAAPSSVSIYGNQDLEEREQAILDFSDGKIQELAAKPVIAGSGCNFQRHCSWAIFLGIGHKFNDFIQAVHRIQRFLQTERVRLDLIYTEAERPIRQNLERKWQQYDRQMEKMVAIIRAYGLGAIAGDGMTRSLGIERAEASGANWTCVNNDCVDELSRMPDNSVGLMVSSIPFATQYEYTPSYNDFGHTDSNDHFWEQMDFLTPQLLRVLQPGRICAIHVKDRITPSGLSGFGFQTVTPFSDECIAHFRKHGFAFLARKTIVTDVVRENNQTYRLGWSEQCKDGTRMGAGMPEYLLVFRKGNTDPSNGYADLPVVKDKGAYTRGRWQYDAHGFMRSSGNRLLLSPELRKLTQADIFKLFKKHSLEDVYDFRFDVSVAEHMDSLGWLPSTFMLLQPQSLHEDVWTDVTRMRTLNSLQSSAGKEMHLCPLQFDVVDRCIEQYTMKGETVLDFFGGLATVAYRAVKLGRKGLSIELNSGYWADGCTYCAAAERDVDMPDMFQLLEQEAAA